MSDMIKYAILGAGPVVSEFYIPAFKHISNSKVLAIIDPIDSSLKKNVAIGFIGKCIPLKFENCWFELEKIDNGPVDGLIIALPNSFHEAASLEALKRGYHVLIEKPVALTAEGCLRIQQKADEMGLIAMAGMVRRYLPGFMAMKECLQQNLIGPIESIEIEDGDYYPWLSDSGFFFRPESGGILADMGVHYLDMVYLLMGECVPIAYTDDFNGGVEANCSIEFKCKEVHCKLNLSRDRKLGNYFTINGKNGKLSIYKDDQNSCFFFLKDSNLIHEIKNVKPFYDGSLPNNFISSFCQEIHDFGQAIQGYREPILSAGGAANVIGLVEWAYATRIKPLKTFATGSPKSDLNDLSIFLPGKLLITGGSGFIGSRLIQHLYNTEHREITAPVRSYKRVVELARFGVSMPRVNLLNSFEIAKEMAGTRWVVHLAYGNEGPNSGKFTFDSTKIIVEEAIKAGVEAVVVLSTAWVYGVTDNCETLSEDSPYRPFGKTDYARAKAKMQKWLLNIAKNSNKTRIVVLNPTCVWGIQGKTYTRLPYQMAKNKKFCWINYGEGLANIVKIESLIEAIILGLKNKDAHGHNFIINEDVITWKKFLEPLLGAFSNDIPSVTLDDLNYLNQNNYTSFSELFSLTVSNREFRNALGNLPYIGRLAKQIGKIIKQKTSYLGPQSAVKIDAKKTEYEPPKWLYELFGPFKTRFSANKARDILGWVPKKTTCEYEKLVAEWVFSVEKY